MRLELLVLCFIQGIIICTSLFYKTISKTAYIYLSSISYFCIPEYFSIGNVGIEPTSD